MESARQDKGQALEHFGASLRRARLAAGMSQDDLARACALHVTEISRLERGVRDPRLTTVLEAARGIGISASELLTDV